MALTHDSDEKSTTDKRVLTARARFNQADESTIGQRNREKEALKFYAGDQWTDTQKKARLGIAADGDLPPVPERPTYVINKVREPVRSVLSSEEQAEFTIEIIREDDFGDLAEPNPDQEAETDLREGFLRRIQNSPDAQDARLWAASRAAQCGTGWYRVMTRFVAGKTRDKEIIPERIFDQASVYPDPAHEKPDGSDCRWLFEGVDMPIEDYNAQHGKVGDKANRVTLSSARDDEWRALGEEAPKWFTTEGKTKSVRVMNYWYLERTPRTLCQMPDGSFLWESELPEDHPEPLDTWSDESTALVTVKWCKIDGIQVLDETDWEGKTIPYVKVLGEELHPYDAERRTEGMVQPMMDAGRGFNAMACKLIEVVGLAPIPSLMVEEGSWEPYKQFYQLANTRTIPALPYKGRGADGQELRAPSSVPRDASVIAPISAALGMLDQAIKSTTGVPDPAMGHQDPTVKSGAMAKSLQAAAQHSTSHYLTNLQRSMRYEGQIENDLLYPIYGTRPGRIARIVNDSNEPQTVRVNQPEQAQMSWQPGAPLPPAPKRYVLTKDANFHVVINVTKNKGTLQEQESELIATVVQAQPQLLTVFGDLFFKLQHQNEMAERMKVMLDPKVQQMLAQKAQGGPEIPPQLMQQMAQQKQQLDDAHTLLQKAMQEIQGEAAKYASAKEIAQMQIDSKERLAALDREAKITVAELGAKVDRLQLFLDERARIGAQLHEETQGTMDRAHEAALAQMDQQHQVAQGAAQAGTAADAQSAQQQHEASQQQAQLDTQAATAQTTED